LWQLSISGYQPAQHAYGMCLLKGYGVPIDHDQAVIYLDQVDKSNVAKWDRIRRTETPVQVKSLELPWLGRSKEKRMMGWKLEIQSLHFIKAFTELEFLASDSTDGRTMSKTVTIQPGVMNEENLSDFEMDIKSFREIESLGRGSFGTVKLMKDIYLKQFAVKYFGRGIFGPDETTARVFSRELNAFCHLHHSCVIQAYRFSRDVEDYEGALVMEYIPNGPLDHLLKRVRKGNPPDFWNHTELRSSFVESLLEWNLFTHEVWLIAI
jgi:hypothetical protein